MHLVQFYLPLEDARLSPLCRLHLPGRHRPRPAHVHRHGVFQRQRGRIRRSDPLLLLLLGSRRKVVVRQRVELRTQIPEQSPHLVPRLLFRRLRLCLVGVVPPRPRRVLALVQLPQPHARPLLAHLHVVPVASPPRHVHELAGHHVVPVLLQDSFPDHPLDIRRVRLGNLRGGLGRAFKLRRLLERSRRPSSTVFRRASPVRGVPSPGPIGRCALAARRPRRQGARWRRRSRSRRPRRLCRRWYRRHRSPVCSLPSPRPRRPAPFRPMSQRRRPPWLSPPLCSSCCRPSGLPSRRRPWPFGWAPRRILRRWWSPPVPPACPPRPSFSSSSRK
mmetsp:Transcript_37248/g.73131  ORF Transcript_37248/g.73131 Transcript_37248/m.73131 type:complete len:332 (-) Transcript_37248:136-1131(-)